ncbi:hypothetical protein BGX29_010138 [Mortierella sp. GBA35]|nr:hypothetical protein BGX29_010138 [Mortierella sp. GBA35]
MSCNLQFPVCHSSNSLQLNIGSLEIRIAIAYVPGHHAFNSSTSISAPVAQAQEFSKNECRLARRQQVKNLPKAKNITSACSSSKLHHAHDAPSPPPAPYRPIGTIANYVITEATKLSSKFFKQPLWQGYYFDDDELEHCR